jgi:hypothetical protein
MFRSTPVTALAIGLTLLAGCASNTTLTSTWKSPDAPATNLAGQSVATVFITGNESQRRSGENALASDLSAQGARAFATFLLLPTESRFDAETAQARLQKAGATAVVTMRVIGQEQRITYRPGWVGTGPYRGFGPYWGMGWGTVYQPGSVRTDTLLSVETLVYSLPAGGTSQLLWASSSRTTNPNGVDALVRSVSRATAREMARQGFLTR